MLLRWLPSFLLSGSITRLLIWFGHKFSLLQPVSAFINHKHKQGTPTLGGIAVFSSFMFCRIFNSLLGFNKEMQHIYYVGTVCFLVGIIDDWTKIHTKKNKGISKLWKLVLLSGLLFLYFIRIFPPLEALIKVSIILCAAGTSDILDGLDGLLCMTAIPILLGLGNAPSISLAGSVLGFLYFNLKPARIFLGDCGAMFIGSIIGAGIISSGVAIEGFLLCLFPLLQAVLVLLKLLLARLRLPHKFFIAPIHHELERRIGESNATMLLVGLNTLTVGLVTVLASFTQLRKF